MIERFNFYDIYGYLLPGLLLLALLWLPIGLLTGTWPPAAWSSAVLALAAAYIAGHILDNLSSAAFPSVFRDKKGRKRLPSDLLFDATDDEVLSQHLWDVKQPIADQIKTDFNIDVQVAAEWTNAVGGRRSSAFFKCRNLLIRQKAASYAEQQQGMYVLMRASAAAFILAFALYIGLAIGAWSPNIVLNCPIDRVGFFVSLTGALIFAFVALNFQRSPAHDERNPRAVVFWLVALALAFGGLISGRHLQILNSSSLDVPPQLQQFVKEEKDPVKFLASERAMYEVRFNQQIRVEASELMIALAGIAAVLTPLCLSAYRGFSVNFAVTVYRDYYRSVIANNPPP